MKSLIFAILTLSTVYSPKLWAAEFNHSVAINIQSLQINVPNSSGEHSLKLLVYLQGRSTGHLTLVEDIHLGRQRVNQPIGEPQTEEWIEISKSRFNGAIYQGGLMGQDESGYDLVFKVKRYRTVIDKVHLSFALSTEALIRQYQSPIPFRVDDPQDRDFIEMAVLLE